MRDLSADRDLRHLSLNTATVREQGDLIAILEAAKRHGISTVSPWRDQVHAVGLARVVKAIRDGGFRLSGYCRGGLFPADAARRAEVRDDNRRAADEAVALGAPCLVVVVGGLPHFSRPGSTPSKDIAGARAQVRDGLAALLDHAADIGLPIALEPLHPMFAAERSSLNTLRQALDLCDLLDPGRSRGLGLTVDAYHVWWDPEVEDQIARAGRDRLLAFHVSDWLTPTTSLLTGRGMMGDGVIELRKLRGMVEAQGFGGACEVEVLSTEWWARLGRRGACDDRRALPHGLLKGLSQWRRGRRSAGRRASAGAPPSRRPWRSRARGRQETSASLTAAETPSTTGTPCSAASEAARSAMPAQPRTIASARSSRSAAAISRETRPRAPESGSSSASTGDLGRAHPRAARGEAVARRGCARGSGSSAASVVTTLKRPATRLAR